MSLEQILGSCHWRATSCFLPFKLCVLAVHGPNSLQLGPVVSAQHMIGFEYVLEYFIWLTYFTLPSILVSCMDICLLLWQMASWLYFVKHRSQLGVPSCWMTAPSSRDPGSHFPPHSYGWWFRFRTTFCYMGQVSTTTVHHEYSWD